MKVLIPQDIMETGKAYLRERGYDVVMGSGFDEETLKRDVADADAVIVRAALFNPAVIDAGKKLKVLARYGVGYENVDIAHAEKKGIYVTLAKNCNHYSVAEHAMMMILALAKSLVYLDRECRKGGWNLRTTQPVYEVRNKTLGIAGVGAIGQHAAKIAHDGFGMNVIAFDPYADATKLPSYITMVGSLEQLLREADAITLHTPSTPETRNMINAKTLKMMKPSAYLVNTGRGGIINEDELYDALKNKVIAGAGLDVFAQEPVNLDNKLLTLDNFILSPHNAGVTVEAADAMSLSCAEAVDDVLSGRKPKYPINNPAV